MAVRHLVTLSAAVLTACSGPERVLAIGQRIHHDDFDYSVQRVDTTDRIGARRAHGVFHIVTFQVENHAQVVDHEWGGDIAYVVDESGRQYQNDAEAQERLAAAEPFDYKARYVTRPGSTETTRLVFDLPREVKEPYLKVRGWLMMGDVFDGNQYKRTRVKLF